MASYVTIDFSQVEDPEPPKGRDKKTRARADRLVRSRAEPKVEEQPALPEVADVATQGTPLSDDLIEAMKATFVRSGGNIAMVARTHNMTPKKVTDLAAQYDWPVYGQGATHGEAIRKTRLENLAQILEDQLFEMAQSLGVEQKAIEDITEKGMGSRYVAPLTQRSSAFSALFDRYMRVMTLLEPEVFGHDDDPSNPVAAKLRQKKEHDALGGVDGVNRQLAEFAARVAVGTVEAMEQRQDGEVVDVNPSG